MKKIPNYSNYSATVGGKIYSHITNKFLKLSLSKGTGYLVVNIREDGEGKKSLPTYVHRLIALTYVENKNNKPFVNHIDGCKTNNDKQNLEWTTNTENMQHGWENNLMKRGSDTKSAKLSEDIVILVCQLFASGHSITEVQKTLVGAVSRGTLANIRARRCWKHISCNYTWELHTKFRNSLSRTCNDHRNHT